MTVIDTIPFYDYEREVLTRLLGADKIIATEIINTVNPLWFDNYRFRKLFVMCTELIKENGFIDIYGLRAKIKGKELTSLLEELQQEICTTADFRFYRDQLKKIYFERRAKMCTSLDEIRQLEKEIEEWEDVTKMVHISTGADELLANYYDKWETSIKTGFKNLDSVVGSFQSGDFIILAGATSSGKTMCALNIMLKMAKAGHKCNYYSLEMSMAQLQNRIISCETGINSAGFRSFTLTEEEQKKHLAYSQDELPKLPIKVWAMYKPLTVETIVNAERKSDSEIVFIDYLGLLKSEIKGSQYEKITEISMSLKRAAMEVNKPFFVLHQLSRDLKDRKEKRPLLSDLRGSGQLEQDADMVLFVHRPAYYDLEADKSELEIIVAKNRHGESARILPFAYYSGHQKIAERGVVTWNK